IQQDSFKTWHVAKARNPVARKSGVANLAILELDDFEKRPTQTHDHRAFHLILQTVRIDNRAALKGCYDALHLHLAGAGIDRDFSAAGDIASLFGATRDAQAMVGVRFRLPPAELSRGFLQHGPPAGVLEILEPT